jgi:hypothetical protein
MFTDLIDIFRLLATMPNRGLVVTEAAFAIIVTFLFALELGAPIIVLVGFFLRASAQVVMEASALPHVRLNDRRALPRPPGARLARPRIAPAATPVLRAADEANRDLAKTSSPDDVSPAASSERSGTPSAPHSIEGLAKAINEAQSWP